MAEPLISFTGLAASYGTFFLAQAYGYAHGRKQRVDVEAKEAIIFGAQHLYHITRLTGRIAWPLTPFLCAIMLLVVLYSPHLRGTSWLVDGLVACLVIASFMGLGAIATDYGRKTWMRQMRDWLTAVHGRLQLFYTIFYVLGVWGLTRSMQSWGFSTWFFETEQAVREMLTHGAIGWILFVAYAGSRYDGQMDFENGCPLAIERKKP